MVLLASKHIYHMKYVGRNSRYYILWNCFWGQEKRKPAKKKLVMKIQEWGRTDAGQPSSFILQIAKICPDWRGKFALIFKFFR